MSEITRYYPKKVVVKYLLFGSIWILVTDRAIDSFVVFSLSPDYAQTLKGLIFVAVTATLLYFVLKIDCQKIQDAVDRKEESEKRYRTAFHNSPGPLWEEDLTRVKEYLHNSDLFNVDDIEEYLEIHPECIQACLTRVVTLEINIAALNVLGLQDREEMHGSLSQLFVDPFAFMKQEIIAIVKGKAQFEMQLSFFQSRERKGALVLRWLVLSDHQDICDRVLISAFDVTDLERVKNKLQKSEEKYRSLLENANEGVAVIQDERIVYGNSQLLAITGYGKDEIRSTAYLDNVYEDDKATIKSLFSLLSEGKEFPRDKELRILNRDREVRWLRINAVMLDWNDKPAVMVLVTDVTEQNRLQQINKEMEAHVFQAQRMESIGTLAGGIAHDFNNLLSAILGYSQLTMEELPPGSREYENLKMVIAAGERANDLVNQILTFSRKKDEKKQPIQVSFVAKEAVKMLRSSIPPHIEIYQDIQTDKFIEIDPSQMHRIIMNLCANSYQSMLDSGGEIRVILAAHKITEKEQEYVDVALPPGDYLRLTVTDNGSGINPAHIDKIFDPYFTTKELDRGTGLGLSVVYGIVKAVGGEIKVKSTPGKGTRFDLFFPEYKEEFQEQDDLEELTSLEGNEKIMVVDDEVAVLKLMQHYLEHYGYRVSAYEHPRDALAVMRQSPCVFDAIVTDLAMPGLTGKELAAEAEHLCPGIPVILCSGLAQEGRPLDEGPNNIHELLQKPFGKEAFIKAVRGALDS
ncbi:hybrid sensor histidine kinase/response regulator [Desulfopila inferna]|uniref:hybrid sensor histidine kinase/response regulator n=1 Tax=Desulfopila inferna TaxID=468528 RepID=UPI001966B8B8|nr:ATP-binding protein [Desulfopila inferna]MBM9606472.1 PAS domain S-box protein [Desulfopila inferna]